MISSSWSEPRIYTRDEYGCRFMREALAQWEWPHEDRLMLLCADGTRILPAYYSDNYVSLLPGEERTITVRAPIASCGANAPHFGDGI